jgi:uncharacterized membrane protein YphA (DoxX/SURF4 family)
MPSVPNNSRRYAMVALRLALGCSFLSAVADRFGLWGKYGDRNVAWGDFVHFTAYTGKLNWYLPTGLVPATAWTATVAEILLGFSLLFGTYLRVTAFLSGLMLAAFGIAMLMVLGVKAPMDYSVFTASAAAFLLGTLSHSSLKQ